MDDAEEDVRRSRLKKVQEKNKRAQARYRAKQKEKMQTFEGQCSKLQEELAAVRAENQKLRAEKAAMEAEMRKMQLTTKASCETSGQAATSNFELPSQSQPIRPVAQPAAAVGGWERFPSIAEQFWNQTLRDIICQKVGEEQAKRVDGGLFQTWPTTEMFAIYKGLVEELQVRLAIVDKKQTADSKKAVADIINAMRAMGRCYSEALTKQERVEGGANLVREASKMHGPPTTEVWQAVLSTARVSPAQRTRILELRAANLKRMEEIFRRRKDIVWELQQATVMPETASMRNAAFSKAVLQSKQLYESLAAEYVAKEEFRRAVFHQVLSELQEARMLVAALPYFVDVAAVADLLAMDPEAGCSMSDSEASEAARQPMLPTILPMPMGNDLAPDMYMNAIAAWSCEPQSGVTQQQQAFMNAPKFVQHSNGFNGGGRSSGFAPLPAGDRAVPSNPLPPV